MAHDQPYVGSVSHFACISYQAQHGIVSRASRDLGVTPPTPGVFLVHSVRQATRPEHVMADAALTRTLLHGAHRPEGRHCLHLDAQLHAGQEPKSIAAINVKYLQNPFSLR